MSAKTGEGENRQHGEALTNPESQPDLSFSDPSPFSDPAEKIICLGVNHQTAPVEIREKLALSADCLHPVVTIKKIPGCRECCFLSTCNRVEVLLVAEPGAETLSAVRRFLFAGSGIPEDETTRYSYQIAGKEAIAHILRVAASLDSMVLGEPQILGQMKEAYRLALEHRSIGPVLHRLLSRSFSVAKRIRTETNIGGNAVSISFAAVQLARKIFGELNDKTVLLAGAGEMAELAAEHLVAQGVKKVLVVNRTLEHAVRLARRFNGEAAGLNELLGQLAQADIMISSTGAPGFILQRADMGGLMRQRHHRPIFLIDIAVPRDLDPALNELDNIYLYDIDDLQQVVESNKDLRRKEADRAEGIVAEESIKLIDWLGSLELSPTLSELRKNAERLREAELKKTLSALPGLSPEQQKKIEMMGIALSKKLLHNPTMFLKNSPDKESRRQRVLSIRQVFGLDHQQKKN